MEPVQQQQWMSLSDIVEETGLSRTAIYAAAKNDTLPVKTIRIGKRILVSREAWEALKSPTTQQEESTIAVANVG